MANMIPSQIFSNYLSSSSRVMIETSKLSAEFELTFSAIRDCISSGGAIFVAGNGGSSCEAVHFVEELVGRYKKDRPGIRAFHLQDSATITCWANDYDFSGIFERQVQALMKPDDLLVVLSTSGNSDNINKALVAAKQQGNKTVAFLGKGGGKSSALADISLVVPSDETSHVQEVHLAFIHMICELLEA